MVITTQPINVTVCLTQSTTASFTCVVEDQENTGITSAQWHILVGEYYLSIGGRHRHMSNPARNGDIITDTLTITDVSVNDDGVLYRCEPVDDVTSMNVTLTVLGMYLMLLSTVVLNSRDQQGFHL